MSVIATTGTPPRPLRDHTQLPDKDGMPVRNTQKPWQSRLLTESLRPVLDRLHPDGNYFIGEDCGIYWREIEPPLDGAKSPDWYYVPDVPRLLDGQLRRSYVLWQELVAPVVILEYASRDGSEERDRTPNKGKFWVYERRIRPAFYGIYEVDPGRVEVFHFVEEHFEPMRPNAHGRFPLPALGVELGIWQGDYGGFNLPWLRWWNADGTLLPSLEDRVEHERLLAEQEHQRAEQERQRAERLAERLRALGQNPDEI